MIHDCVLPPAHVFAGDSDRLIPLTTGRHLRLALQRYLVPTSAFALTADISHSEMQSALESRLLSGAALRWYQRMRRYEHEIATTIDSDIKQYGESVLPRFLSDRHMAMYSPRAWEILPSARLACGIGAWVSSNFADGSQQSVKIFDFNQVRYTQWLDQNAFDHDASALDFWLAKQA